MAKKFSESVEEAKSQVGSVAPRRYLEGGTNGWKESGGPVDEFPG